MKESSRLLLQNGVSGICAGRFSAVVGATLPRAPSDGVGGGGGGGGQRAHVLFLPVQALGPPLHVFRYLSKPAPTAIQEPFLNRQSLFGLT